MTAIPWHQNDELFKSELANGYFWQQRVAGYFERRGLHVIRQVLRVRPDIADADAYTDDADMYVEGKRIEVKSRRLHFTCRGDYPYDTVMVERVNARVDPVPLGTGDRLGAQTYSVYQATRTAEVR